MYDILIKNGIIIDGTGMSRFQADIAIKDGKIIEIGEIRTDHAKSVLDAEGLYIAPGFIDSHSHSDWVVFMGYAGKSVLEQGITTEICGNCGSSVAPLMPYEFDNFIKIPDEIRLNIENLGGDSKAVFDALDLQPMPTNMAMFIGQGVVRGKVMNYESREPSKNEIREMQQIVREGMEAGALGLSSGLIYPPGSYSSKDELIELCSVVGEFGGAYATHMRDEGDYLVESVQETIEIGEKSNTAVVFSHHKVDSHQNEGKSELSLKLIEQAKQSGRRILVDMYPYTGAGAALMATIPHQFASEGKAALVKKLQDKTIRSEIEDMLCKPSSTFANILYHCSPKGVLVSGIDDIDNGKSLQKIADDRGKDAYSTLFDLLVEYPDAKAIYLSNCLSDMENILKRPYVAFGVDGVQSDIKDPSDHPRAYATFPKIIGEYCRDKAFFSLEECIHRMTGMVADFYGFDFKGRIQVGQDADLVVFDYTKMNGLADYGKADIANEGIQYVFVNGKLSVQNGVCTGERAGKLLRFRQKI